MLYKYIILIISILIFSLYNNVAFAVEGNCEALAGFEKYECQSEYHCEKYKPEDITYKVEPFVNTENANLASIIKENVKPTNYLEVAKKTYRENQNAIYACSIMKVQQNNLNLIKDKLIKIDKSGTLSSKMQRQIELQLSKLKNLGKNQNCNITDRESIYAKKDVLTESIYQLCQYRFYLDYMGEYYDDIQNVLANTPGELQVQTYGISYISRVQALKEEEILLEIEHSHTVFEMAFQAYIGYESNLGVHILLELIKEDFIVYREKLHKAISPITQVVYKISNAMSTN